MRPLLLLLMLVMMPIGCRERPLPTSHRRDGASTQLTQLLTTNGHCKVRLLPPWMGEARETIQTGIFTNELPKINSKDDSHLRFDWFSRGEPLRVPSFEVGPITITESAIGAEMA